MTRRSRSLLKWAGGILLLVLLLGVAGIEFVQSSWFYNKVRQRIVSVAENATGGGVEIARFSFDWHTLTATVDGFTLHGTEPISGPPLLHVDRLTVGLKIISILKRDVDLALLRIDHPQAFLLVAADGTTNVPNPKNPSKSNKSATETILDLAVQRFELNGGAAEIHAAGQPPKTQSYSARGDNLRTLFTYDPAVPRYHGDLSVAPLNLTYDHYLPVQANIATTIAIEKNRLVVEQAKIGAGPSEIDVNGRIDDFTAPVVTAEYRAKVSVGQVGDILKLKSHQSGWLEANGSASYHTADNYAISGFVKAYDVAYRVPGIDLKRIRLQAKIDGGPKSVSIDDFVADALGGQIVAKAELKNFEDYKVNGQLKHFDVRTVASLATREKLPYDGSISGPVFAEGRLSQLQHNRFTGTARLTISPARNAIPVHGLIDAKFNAAKNTLDLGQSFIALPNTRLDVQGTLGQQLNVHLVSSNLDDLLPAMQVAAKPGQAPPVIPLTLTPQGQVSFDGTVTGKLATPVLNGHLGGSNFIVQQQRIDSVNADISASSSGVQIRNGSLRQQGVSAKFDGSAGLQNWKPVDTAPLTANIALQNGDLTDLLAIAGQKNIPVTGTLTVSARVNGTIGNPQAVADLTLAGGQIEGEPYGRLIAHLDAPQRTSQTLKAQLVAGSKQLNLDATYAHSANDFVPGSLTFHVASNTIAMTQVVTLHQREPDLAGSVKLTADGVANITRDKAGNLSVLPVSLNANLGTSDLQLGGRRLGNIDLTANTLVASNGNAPVIEAKLRSNLADASITGDGKWTLAGDYPGSAHIQFGNLHIETARRLLLTKEQAESMPVGGSVEGTLDLSGPAAKPEQLRASLDIPKLEVHRLPTPGGSQVPLDLSVRNDGPIHVTLANNKVTVDSARLVAQDSNFSITGSATISPAQNVDLRLNGNINLAIIHLFSNDIVSSGAVLVNAGVRGTFSNPALNGTLEIKNANLAVTDVPNGLSNANGTLVFNGSQATIRDLTAESGGGKVQLGGFVSFINSNLAFRLRADAHGVRVRYPQGVSTLADANLTMVGTTARSILSGTVTIDRLAFNPRTDLGSVLSSASAPPETPSASTGFTSNLQFDVQIQTAPDITFESSYTQSLEADANLRLRGTIANPVLLGRVNITQGDLTFFGNQYTITQGSISFYNPVKLEPILNVDLETVARGVDVTVTFSGPVTKLNVSYRSDPPLAFSDLVALLATGRTPNDATIAARQPTAPAQSWQQMGASALVGQAIANPVAGRLQRFFGVSSLKIDPTISGVTNNPQAKVTLEQQITPDLTFTYITDVANAEEQVIRVEWEFSRTWSAVAMRDENGEFGVDFLYKKRFK